MNSQDTPECNTRVAIYTSELNCMKEKINEMMDHVEGAVDLETNGCTPYFIFLRNGKPMRAFSGVVGPEIIEFLTNNMPAIKKPEDDDVAQ